MCADVPIVDEHVLVTQLLTTPFTTCVARAAKNDVVMSASAIDFLKEHGMDWQQWISKGIPYVNRAKEVRTVIVVNTPGCKPRHLFQASLALTLPGFLVRLYTLCLSASLSLARTQIHTLSLSWLPVSFAVVSVCWCTGKDAFQTGRFPRRKEGRHAGSQTEAHPAGQGR